MSKNKKPILVTLGEDKYKKPEITYTEKLTKDDIAEKLENYEKVTNINDVPIGTHIRYFTTENGEKKFRLGGLLINKSGLPEYVVISTGTRKWSVQTKDTIFFKQMSIPALRREYELKLNEKDKIIDTHERKIKELTQYIYDLQKGIKKPTKKKLNI